MAAAFGWGILAASSQAMTRANKLIEKEVDADADELEREIDAAAREDAG